MKSKIHAPWQDLRSHSVAALSAVMASVLFLAMDPLARAVGPDETTKIDCGANALFVLLQLEGRPVSVETLDKSLPVRHPDGYSMAELSQASEKLGLGLQGIRFAKGDRAPQRPSIAFLKDAKGGHYAVIRPVGTTGKMVQVIDAPHAPWITDYDRLVDSRPWTGRILTRREPWPMRHAASLLAASGCLVLVLGAARGPKRRSSRTTAAM
jgi:hypothetical protein